MDPDRARRSRSRPLRPIELGVVLAGGQSRRMGRDKSRLRWQGRTLLQHARAQLAAAGCRPVLVCGGPRADIADRLPGSGPVGALVSIVRHAAGRWRRRPVTVLIGAVDQPLLTPSLLGELAAGLAADGGVDAVCYRDHPLPLALRLGPRLRLAVAWAAVRLGAGDGLSMRRLLARLALRELTPGAEQERQLANANTPEEWRACLQGPKEGR
jgi:molybdopterin-guanine dinucleotide biosynthesis protein A